MRPKILFLLLVVSTGLWAGTLETPVLKGNESVAKVPIVLGQNYPNPAKGKTIINVDFTSPEAVLCIYNVLGKLVETLVISNDKKVITLDVSDYKEGIYLYTLEAGGQKVTKRMTVSK